MGESHSGVNSNTDKKGGSSKETTRHKLRFVYTNIDGLNKLKGDETNITLNQLKPDVVFMTETKMSADQVITQFIECSNYNVFRKDRNSGKGGGVLILVRNDIIAQEYIDIIWENIETVVVQLKLGHHVMRLACIYSYIGHHWQMQGIMKK